MLHGLQFISAGGDKRFLTGTAKTGCYFGIGKQHDKLLIAEAMPLPQVCMKLLDMLLQSLLMQET